MSDNRKAWYLDDSDEDFFEEEEKVVQELVLEKTQSAPIKQESSETELETLNQYIETSRPPWRFLITSLSYKITSPELQTFLEKKLPSQNFESNVLMKRDTDKSLGKATFQSSD